MKIRLNNLVMMLCMSVAAMSFSGCKDNDEKQTNDEKEESMRTDKMQIVTITSEKKTAIGQSVSSFSWNMLAEVAKQSEKGQNYVISPLSMAIDLGMLQNAANGDTEKEIINAIGLGSYTSAEVNSYFSTIVNDMKAADPKVTLNVANAAFYNTDIVPKLGKDFTSFITNQYDALVEGGTFDNTMKDKINGWCNEKTNGLIPKIIDDFAEDAVVELLNAIYFEGDFKNPLENTSVKMNFTNDKGEKVKQYFVMCERPMGYAENDEVKVAELPLGDGVFTAFFVLPAVGKDLVQTTEYLADNWNSIAGEIKDYEVNFSAPRFKVEFECGGDNMKKVLNGLGIYTMYDRVKAELMYCLDKEDWSRVMHLSVSDVTQKAFYELSDKGVKAGAVTVISMSKNGVGLEEVKYMALVRPFIFGVREKTTGAILFNGICNDPSLIDLGISSDWPDIDEYMNRNR